MSKHVEGMENRYPGALGFYHPNTKGQGAALRLEPRFSNGQGERYNCFFLEMAAQQAETPDRTANSSEAGFHGHL